jgi:nicotinate dehydrogenase subunit A
MTEEIAFALNGAGVTVTALPSMPLLYALRGELGRKGTRFGCGTGNCGACTVTLDGVPVTSCNTPLSAVAGRAVGTVEGVIAADHPLIAALIRHQAGQCGYCLPGIITRAAALIDHGKGVAEIRAGLDENLCRCGAHQRIMAAIAEVVS